MLIASVVLENTTTSFDKEFDYYIPDKLINSVQEGVRVLVPFGSSDNTRQGMVLSIKSKCETDNKIKTIVAVLDSAPLLSHEELLMIPWIQNHCFCTYYDVVKLFLPIGLQYKMHSLYSLSPDFNENNELTSDENKIVVCLRNKPHRLKKDILSACEFDENSKIIELMVKKNIIVREVDAKRNIGDLTTKMVRINEQLDHMPKLTPKQHIIINLLNEAGTASIKEICYFTGISQGVIKNLAKKEICIIYEHEILRNPIKAENHLQYDKVKILSEEQEKAYKKLYKLYASDKSETALLFGITGSGKTSVYLKLIDNAVADNKSVIVLVPEISLTPQTVSIFISRYNNNVAVLHSGLSVGERLDEWKRIKSGKAKIIVGTRSAIFAPAKNIGLIIIDEEQEYTYKSEKSPCYDARNIARFRCAYNKGLLVLTSATPSIETYYKAQTGQIGFVELLNRYGNSTLPEVKICDMNEELLNGNTSMFSHDLIDALMENLNIGKQSILLMNRRGYNTFASCTSCGEVVTCPNCSISLTYHKANNRLMCHYCGYSIPFTDECPSCHSHSLTFKGAGTQKLEEELNNILPSARILRLDADSALSKNSYEKKLMDFKNHKYDLIIGTQMVSKGLDFEDVTVVGVLSADQALYHDDFRSYERAFDLITQVVGRAGRGNYKGIAFIQTYTPENSVITMASHQDYKSFYNSEIIIRKSMLYPPFADICTISFNGSDEKRTQNSSADFLKILKDNIIGEYKKIPLVILNSVPDIIEKSAGKYHYHIIIKCRNSKTFRNLISISKSKFHQIKYYRNILVSVSFE